VSQGTKIFGMRIALDPKLLVGLLVTMAIGLMWYNFSGGDDHAPSGTHPTALAKTASSIPAPASRNLARRADAAKGKLGALRMKPVDPTRGDIDPTLKLWLLDKVREVKPLESGRNLFETGSDVAQVKMPPMPKVAPMVPKPLPGPGTVTASGPPPPPMVNIPLRYYGFVKPSLRGDGNRGYFMDGENILMATEGDVLESRFLVVALSPNTARVEDIQMKQGQDLQLIPEAIAQ
jgi:hypothetical protein